MKTTTIISHKGYLGAVTDLENGKFENTGAPMFRVNVEEVQITESAKNIIKNARKEAVGVPDIIILSDNTISLANIAQNFMGNAISVNADADLDIIDAIEVISTEAIDIDPDFVEYVNEIATGEYTEPVTVEDTTETEDSTSTNTDLTEEGNTPVIIERLSDTDEEFTKFTNDGILGVFEPARIDTEAAATFDPSVRETMSEDKKAEMDEEAFPTPVAPAKKK